MTGRASRGRLQSNPLFRGVAVLLLLVPCADLAIPGACVEEFLDVTETAAAGPASHTAPLTDTMAPADLVRSTGTASVVDPEGDCYCCCSHLVVSRVYVLPLEWVDVDETPSARCAPRLVAPRACFHPPRLV